MFDATGRPDSGVLKGGFSFLGYYSECIQAVPDPLESHFQPPFVSSYCLATVSTAQVDTKQSVVSVRPVERNQEVAAASVMSQGQPPLATSCCFAVELTYAADGDEEQVIDQRKRPKADLTRHHITSRR